MREQRFDRVAIKATRTDEGFIRDTPIVTRSGIFPYCNADGSTRYEYRPPDEVFRPDSLATLQGKPITTLDKHQSLLDRDTVRGATVGTILSAGRRDGENMIADIVIHDPTPVERGHKELSLGYQCDLDMTPGTAPDGQKYDCIQRSIKVNHLALVPTARAGHAARLNLDAADIFPNNKPEDRNMAEQDLARENGEMKVKLEAAIARADAAEAKLAAAEKDRDEHQARADTVTAEVDALKAKQTQIKADAVTEAKARLDLEAKAAEFGVAVKADSPDADLMRAVVKAVRGDTFEFRNDSADYLRAAYDLAVQDGPQKSQQGQFNAPPAQRNDGAPGTANGFMTEQQRNDAMIARMNGAQH